MRGRDVVGQRNVQLAVKAIGSGLHTVAGLLQGGEHARYVFEELLARAGQPRAARGAGEQHHAII